MKKKKRKEKMFTKIQIFKLHLIHLRFCKLRDIISNMIDNIQVQNFTNKYIL